MLSRSFPVSWAASMCDTCEKRAAHRPGRWDCGSTPQYRAVTRGSCTRNSLTHGAHHPTGNTSFLAFFSPSHAFFHNSRAGILSVPFIARRMCVNPAPRPQTRGFFNAIWPPERSVVRVSAEILLAGSSPMAEFYIPVAQSVERWSPKPKAAGSGPAGNAICVP